jgi:multidrug resistance efflux pump
MPGAAVEGRKARLAAADRAVAVLDPTLQARQPVTERTALAAAAADRAQYRPLAQAATVSSFSLSQMRRAVASRFQALFLLRRSRSQALRQSRTPRRVL